MPPSNERPLRVVVVTPSPIGSNPRVVKEADALHEAGYDVTVIATRTLDHVDHRDASLMQRIGWQLRRIDLRGRIRWRAHRSIQTGFRRAFLTTGRPSLADLGASAFTQPLLRETLRTPADLYIAHYPPALPAAAAAARRYGARYAFDAEDFHPGDWPASPSYDAERRLVCAIERRHLPGAAYVTAAAPAIADAYAATYAIPRPTVALNVFLLAQAPHGPTARGTAVPSPSIYWFSQTVGPNRGIECAITAIGRATTRPHLYLRGTPAAGYASDIARLAAEAGATGRVHILPPAAPDDMERLAAIYDVGLVAETGHSRNRELCLTNKLFSFILAGVPPLMSDTPAQRAFAGEAGLDDLLYAIDDAPALARLIDRILGDPARLAALRHEIWRLGQSRYNWDLEKTKVVDRVAAGLATNLSHRQAAEAARVPS
jgi:glycosyltransferase involved in cell wall biosynthesis